MGSSGLLGFQGLLGWYMVKSGLDHNNFLGPCDVPRVSQYRLAAHLSSAVVLYSFLFWSAKSVLRPSITWSQVTPSMASFRKLVIGSKALAFITLVSGAFEAGCPCAGRHGLLAGGNGYHHPPALCASACGCGASVWSFGNSLISYVGSP